MENFFLLVTKLYDYVYLDKNLSKEFPHVTVVIEKTVNPLNLRHSL